MRVLIDARAAARPELGGVERWARELSARLPALDPGRYRVARPPAALAHRPGHAWEQLWLPLRRADVLLCPANLAPLAGRRTVVVIHDVAALREPGWYSDLYVRWQRTVLPRIARRARLVITPSAFSRDEVVELLGVAPERVRVVHGGVDGRFTPAADVPAARAALGLASQPYVLTVASRTARKNLAALEPAAERLARRGVQLVAAGGDRPQFRGATPVSGVRALGHVDDALLPGLYAGAAAFVLPSLYEGFGLTALEALAAGVPVVAADRGALPEVCGDAAQLVDPTDPEALAGALERALDDPAPWRAAGPPRAAPLTWDATARAVDALLRGLA
ncbi:glycosyltransferase family 4 protein [Baekduia soli]|uniref:glycosyltransferase family 4 protein n=1 Tax=Baekduia soli TaxID=496014 RepID=UPI001651E658|nr:glycosyltransferase family 1 protein [Baekduia soli]